MPHNKLSDEILLLTKVNLEDKNNHLKLKECLTWLAGIADTKYTEINKMATDDEWRVVANHFDLDRCNS